MLCSKQLLQLLLSFNNIDMSFKWAHLCYLFFHRDCTGSSFEELSWLQSAWNAQTSLHSSLPESVCNNSGSLVLVSVTVPRLLEFYTPLRLNGSFKNKPECAVIPKTKSQTQSCLSLCKPFSAACWRHSLGSFPPSISFSPAPQKSHCVRAKSVQFYLTLCNSMECSPPGCSVHGILPARMLERVAMPSSRGSSPPRDGIRVPCISCIGSYVLYH